MLRKNKMTKYIPISLKIRDIDLEKLENFSNVTGISKSAALRTAFLEYYKKWENQQ